PRRPRPAVRRRDRHHRVEVTATAQTTRTWPALLDSPCGENETRMREEVLDGGALTLALRLPRQLLPLRRAEEALAKSDRLRRHLDQLIVLDILQGGFESQLPRRL